MKTFKFYYLSGFLILLSQQVLAGEYVPPPSGPYKPSVIVDTNHQTSGSSMKVYRFPSDGLIQSEQRIKQKYSDNRNTHIQPQHLTKEPSFEPPVAPAETSKPVQQVTTQQALPTVNEFAGNPWSPDSEPPISGNYQGYWNNQQFSYPQQNPYGYSNQNNYTNNPFNGMPTPWSAMPMQPFFSGK